MKWKNVGRLIILTVTGVTMLVAVWSLPSGREITFEEAVLGLLYGILAVLVINGGER
jgi:hypothetical protein